MDSKKASLIATITVTQANLTQDSHHAVKLIVVLPSRANINSYRHSCAICTVTYHGSNPLANKAFRIFRRSSYDNITSVTKQRN